MRLALAGTQEERSNLFSAAGLAAQIVGRAWPPGEDTEPVLDELLALEPIERGFDSAKPHLASVLRHPPSGLLDARDSSRRARVSVGRVPALDCAGGRARR